MVSLSVRPYDFSRPERLLKVHIQRLRAMHETFAQSLAASLSSELRTSVHIQLDSIDQLAFRELAERMAETLVFPLQMPPLPGTAWIEVDRSMAAAMLDRLLGGDGSGSDRDRHFTNIELTLLGRLGGHFARALRESWRTTIALEPRVGPACSGLSYAGVSPNECIASVSLRIGIFELEGDIRLDLPCVNFQSVLRSSAAGESDVAGPQEEFNTLHASDSMVDLAAVTLPLIAELGRSSMTFRELLALGEGQIIPLDTLADGELLLRLGDAPKFLGRPGVAGRTLAVQITQILGDEGG